MTDEEIERLKVVLDRYKNSRCGTEDLNEIYDGCVSALKALESSRTAHAAETAALERAAECRALNGSGDIEYWLEYYREVKHD